MHGPVHQHRCRVIYGDTDAGGVVYYANYLRYCEAARTEFMRERALSYKEIEEQGFILPVVECQLRYKASARYDDLLRIETCLLEVKPRTCRFNYRIFRESDGKMLAQGYTVHAIVDLKGRLARFPDKLLAALVEQSPSVL
jgi:acyl-CoA thioester hydrolase